MDIPSETIALVFFGNKILLIASGFQLHHQSERLERDCSELHLVGSYCWEALEWSAAERPQEKYENTKILKFKNTELQKYRDT